MQVSLFVDIKKTFPDFELSARLECGNEVTALFGASGCGKSLTLKCIAGIENPDEGRIILNDTTVFDSRKGINLPPQKRKVGYLFQSYALFPNKTVWNNIGCVIKKPEKEKSGIIKEILKAFYLENVKGLYPKQISGGQQQRVALARILVSNPQILMLDEPFSALDSHLKWNLEQEIISVLADFKGTTIFVSHNRNEVYRISEKIAVMSNGKIERVGNKKDIFDSPKTLASAKITGCENISKAERLEDYLIKATDWGITLQTETIVPNSIKYVGIHAHHFEIARDRLTGINLYLCRIHRIIDAPFEKIVVFSINGENSCELYLNVSEDKWDDSKISGDFVLGIPKNKIIYLE